MAYTDYAVGTKLGVLTVRPTQADHLYAEGVLATRGVSYKMSAHLHLWEDGLFHVGREFATDGNYRLTEPKRLASPWDRRRDLYATRQDGWTDATTHAKDTMLAAVEPAVQVWVKKNPLALLVAQRTYLEGRLVAAEEELAKARKVVTEADTAVADLKVQLEAAELADVEGRLKAEH